MVEEARREKSVVGVAAGWGVVALLVFLGLSWVLQGNQFFLYKLFAPKEAAVERQVFEETKSYNTGFAQEVEAMELAYTQADAAHKAAIGSLLLHRVAGYDESKLPSVERSFLATVRSEQGLGQ
jgi:hypothetical protein